MLSVLTLDLTKELLLLSVARLGVPGVIAVALIADAHRGA